MVNKQAVLQTIQSLPDSANWAEISNALLNLVAREGSVREFVNLYRAQLSPKDLEEYAQPNFDISLGAMIEELEARHPRKDRHLRIKTL
jgi:hypothetical protein